MLAGRMQHIEQADLGSMTRPRLEAFVESIAALESFLASRRLSAMAAIDSLNDGGASSDSVFRSKGKAASKDARTAAKTANALTGMPTTAERLANGEITEAHANANAAAAEQTQDPAGADDALNNSRVVPPADLHQKRAMTWGRTHEARDNRENRRLRQHHNRKVIVGRCKEDGSWSLYATTTTDIGRELQGLIEAEADRLFRTEDGGRGSDTDRTRAQRLVDALGNLLRRGSGQQATSRGGPTHPRFQPVVRVTMGDSLDEIAGELIGDGPLPDSTVQRILCESGLDVIITADDGQPLWLGRTTRNVSAAQWRALIERDEGCVVCGAEPSMCEAHHVVWWSRHGSTDITNLVLLCTACHHNLHDRGHELVKRDGTWLLEPPEPGRAPNSTSRRRRQHEQQPRAA
ncbi:MAG: DUF222 domain-containing protein [Actinomycetota bacterium]